MNVRPANPPKLAGARTAFFRRTALRAQPRVPGFTLVEVMVAMFLLAVGLSAFLGTFIQSRRVTESSVLHAAASSLVYGLIEQMKGLDYTNFPDTSLTPSEVRLRVSPDEFIRLKVVYTPATSAPKGPLTLPSETVTATELGAIDNTVGPLNLSTAAGTQSQQLKVSVWVWVDEIPDVDRDVKEVKKTTVIYTYSYQDGSRLRTVRDREVFLRTRFDQ